MWLLNTASLELQEFFGSNIPEYAILSHTWEHGEVLFHELQSKEDHIKYKPGYRKIETFCDVAKNTGCHWAWMDSCCIDKRSSAELSEAINSMYKWYKKARFCVIYLADVSAWTPGADVQSWRDEFMKSRWFTRGWTLQELIAQSTRYYYAQDWSRITSDDDRNLVALCAMVTTVPLDVLNYSWTSLSRYPVATRMSWAAQRQTTRSEDRAYSLMGIFGVSIAILYGEGLRGAFRRLQDEIMKKTCDESLFAWRGPYEQSGLLARSPSDFAETPDMALLSPAPLRPFSMTNSGLSVEPEFWQPPDTALTNRSLILLQCIVQTKDGWVQPLLHMKEIPDVAVIKNGKSMMAYRRTRCDTWALISPYEPGTTTREDCLVMENEHLNVIPDGLPLGMLVNFKPARYTDKAHVTSMARKFTLGERMMTMVEDLEGRE